MAATRFCRFAAALSAAVFVAATAGCASRVELRGNLPNKERLAQVTVGSMSREEVAEILGSPSSVTPFSSDIWLYISEKTETVAFLKPEILERNVIAVRFDKDGVVQEMKNLDLSAARELQQVERVTPTSGNELTIWDQFFKNLGRFGAGSNSIDGF